MGAPHTLDLRKRVVAAFRSGMSRLETATLFRVSEPSVQRWSRLDREKGSVVARSMGGHRPFALAGERDRILERIAQQPDLPLRALLAELHDRGVKVSYFVVNTLRNQPAGDPLNGSETLSRTSRPPLIPLLLDTG
jgi:transposase